VQHGQAPVRVCRREGRLVETIVFEGTGERAAAHDGVERRPVRRAVDVPLHFCQRLSRGVRGRGRLVEFAQFRLEPAALLRERDQPRRLRTAGLA
jgi:hypothetical protein